MRSAGSEQTDTDLRKILGAFLFSGDDVDKPAGVLSGGEKTRLALAGLIVSRANVLLLDEPTNNLDPVSREQVLDAIANYPGAIVLVTHDAGAVQALKPDRAILLPDGDEDAWSDRLGREHGITAIPGCHFHAKTPHLRIPFGGRREARETLLERLASL
jgi:ATPase subunit of ABC transporter with duplicated ATPase domains